MPKMTLRRLSVAFLLVLVAACSAPSEVAPTNPTSSDPAPRECEADPNSPIDVASEPDWRQYADYLPWTDTEGCLVRIDVLAERPGPDHCDWQDSRVLIAGDPIGSPYTDSADDVEYVRDPNGVYGVDAFVNGFEDGVDLPEDAVDSGYRQAGRQLWFSAGDPDAAFIRSGDNVERWPRGEVPGCA